MPIVYFLHLAIAQVLTREQKLYHQTLAIRPKLIKLIEKYSQKKGDCTCWHGCLGVELT